jgi:hypothetical protein
MSRSTTARDICNLIAGIGFCSEQKPRQGLVGPEPPDRPVPGDDGPPRGISDGPGPESKRRRRKRDPQAAASDVERIPVPAWTTPRIATIPLVPGAQELAVSVTRNSVKTAVWLQAWAKDAGTWMLVQSEGSGVVLPASRGQRVADALRKAAGQSLEVPYPEKVPGKQAWYITYREGAGVGVALATDEKDRPVLQIVQAKFFLGHHHVLKKKAASIMMPRPVALELAKKIEEMLGASENGNTPHGAWSVNYSSDSGEGR